MTSFRLALGLFTIIPVGGVGADPSRRTVRAAVLWAPVVGVLVGVVGAVVLVAGRNLFGEEGPGATFAVLLASCCAIVAMEFITGALHLDGLADTADGLAARGDRERTATVMRDPQVGAVGALAIVVVMLVNVLALATAVSRGHGTEAIVAAALAARVAIVWGCTRSPARPDGLGHWVARTIPVAVATAVTLVALLVPVALSLLDDDVATRSLWFAVAAIPAGLGLAALGTWRIRHILGGITGDVLGASAQLATTGTLLLLACAP